MIFCCCNFVVNSSDSPHSNRTPQQQQQQAAAGRKPDAMRAVAPICIGYGWFLDDDSWRGGGEHQSRPSMAEEVTSLYMACMSDFYCGICAENFSDGARCPRVMPCGHSVCHTCAVRIVPDQRCPSCRAPFSVARAEDMPKNWAVVSILQSVQPVPRARDYSPAPPSAAEAVPSIAQPSVTVSMSCDICTGDFHSNETYLFPWIPRVMPCGHSICHTCAVRTVPDQRCPSCRAPFSFARAEDMPKNWAVLSILQRVNVVPTTSLQRLCHKYANTPEQNARTGIIAAAQIGDVDAVRGYIIADANCVNERGQ